MIAFNNMSVTFGQLVASAIGAGFQHVHGEGWRATVGIGAAPPIALAGLLLLCPESPRQLVSHGKYEAAENVLLKIYPTSTNEQRLAKIKSIELSLQEATQGMADESLWITLKRIFTTPATGRAVLTACMVMAISQLGGFNTVSSSLVHGKNSKLIDGGSSCITLQRFSRLSASRMLPPSRSPSPAPTSSSRSLTSSLSTNLAAAAFSCSPCLACPSACLLPLFRFIISRLAKIWWWTPTTSAGQRH